MFGRKLTPVWIGIILLSGMFLMGQTSECPWAEGVSIPDDILESLIRWDIGKLSGPICASDLERLTRLEHPNSDISDLTGLEYCTGLGVLTLSGNQISDLTPLAGLTDLMWLYLDDIQISDITPLAGLTGLWGLTLSGNQISDLSPLAGLTNLRELILDDNQISDIYPLVQNPGIGYLDGVRLNNNPLDETSCTVYIPELESRGVYVVYNPADCP